MRREAFPDPLTYDFPPWTAIGPYLFRSNDIVAFGVPLNAANVREAYHKGIFPWYTEGLPLPWHCPEWRAVLDLEHIRITRSLAKLRRKGEYTYSIDRAVERVMHECASSYRP